MSDLIDRQAAIDAIEWTLAGKAAFDAIKALPSAQPERKTGEWIETKHDLYDYFICSECCAGFTDGFQYRYCPNCGANMRTPTQVQLDEADDVMMGGKHGETD